MQWFKGGGSAPEQKVQVAEPPPSATDIETQRAQEDQRRQAANRKGLRRTVLAGDTGAYGINPNASLCGGGRQ